MGEQAERAAENFFKPANLTALRELAIAMRPNGWWRKVYPGRERLLVSVTAAPMSPRLVRATARLAASLGRPMDRRARGNAVLPSSNPPKIRTGSCGR